MGNGARLRGLLEHGKEYAVELFRADGVIEATAVVTAGRESFLLVRDLEREHQERAAYLESIARCARVHGASAVCLVEERTVVSEAGASASGASAVCLVEERTVVSEAGASEAGASADRPVPRGGPQAALSRAGEPVRSLLLVTAEDASGVAVGAVAEILRQGVVAELGTFRSLSTLELSRLAPRFFEVQRALWN